MRNNNINTIINDITPNKEVVFGVVIKTIFNSFLELNKTESNFPLDPNELDELEFECWFSWN